MRLLVLDPFDAAGLESDVFEAFIELRDRLYANDYYHYPEGPLQRALLRHYAARTDYRLALVVLEDGGRAVGRVLVGASDGASYAFLGFFECPDEEDPLRVLMDEAVRLARRTGCSELRGPIDVNAMHGWMFLEAPTSTERWVGDPYHAAFYPGLFRRYGFEIAETAFSGVLDPDYETDMLRLLEPALARIAAAGVVVKTLGEFDLQAALPQVCDLVNASFDEARNGYRPVPMELVIAQYRTLLDRLRDPWNVVTLWRGDRIIALSLSYANFIDTLANPDGAKPRPHAAPQTPRFTTKTIAIDPRYRGGSNFLILFLLAARRARQLGDHLGWRRANRRSAAIKTVQYHSRITHTYRLFRLALR